MSDVSKRSKKEKSMETENSTKLETKWNDDMIYSLTAIG